MEHTELKEMIDETQLVMNRNLAERLYGDNTLAAYLARHGRKPVKWSIGSEFHRFRRKVGQLFLSAANALGEYNDCD